MRPSLISRAPVKEWLVLIFDKPLANRLKFRELHLQGIPATIGNPVVNAGAILSKDGSDKLIGSHFNLKGFHNEQEVVHFLKQDIYAKEGVWDFDNIIINPVYIATREAKPF